jgi:hypothetical protein
MLTQLSRWLVAFASVVMISPASVYGTGINSDQREQRATKIPGTDYEILLDGRERQPTPALLTVIET